ncbi:MAG: hypothetical protein ACE5NA_12540 [Nitrospiraceae bacterium]
MKRNKWAVRPARLVQRLSPLVLVFVLSVASAAAEGTDPAAKHIPASRVLDGKKFFGPGGAKGKKPHHNDELVFKDGTFRSVQCNKHGFGAAPYTTTIQGDVVHFQAETTSPTQGKIVWQGTMNGDTLEATFLWTKERWYWTIRNEYWFKGTLQE